MNYKIARGNDEINSCGGISLIGKLFDEVNIFKDLDHLSGCKTKKGHFSHSGILKAMTGLFCQGRSDYTNINLHKDDAVFLESLGLDAAPSEVTLRQRLDEISQVVDREVIANNISLLKKVRSFGEEKDGAQAYTPVDLDVTPMENSNCNKENVGRTYKGHDGFAPMMAYIGSQGYTLNCELRPGVQHSQKEMVPFLTETIDLAKQLNVDNALYRMDSAHDAAENIDLLQKESCLFVIKRNLRKESLEQWKSMAETVGKCRNPRPGKSVYTGIVSHMKPVKCKSNKPLFTAFEVTVRTTDAKGEKFLIPDIEVNSWWTNLAESEDVVIQLYKNHGTSEQYHSEFKTDMNIEQLASGKFKTNYLLLQLAMVAFNALRIVGQMMLELKECLPIKTGKIMRRRIGSVIKDLIFIGCKRVVHANRVWLKLGRSCAWFDIFEKLYATI